MQHIPSVFLHVSFAEIALTAITTILSSPFDVYHQPALAENKDLMNGRSQADKATLQRASAEKTIK